jgi:hypothetical protein
MTISKLVDPLQQIWRETHPDRVSIELVDGVFVQLRAWYRDSELRYQKSFTIDELKMLEENDVNLVSSFIEIMKESEGGTAHAIRSRDTQRH